MRPDPPVRADGRCFVCHGPRKVPKGKWAREAAEQDPFCSNACARAFHGCSLPTDPQAPSGHPRRYEAVA